HPAPKCAIGAAGCPRRRAPPHQVVSFLSKAPQTIGGAPTMAHFFRQTGIRRGMRLAGLEILAGCQRLATGLPVPESVGAWVHPPAIRELVSVASTIVRSP